MMRSLTTPADEDGAHVRAAAAAAVPAALADASVWCLPVHTVVTSGAGATFPLSVFIPVFLAAFAATVALATRYRTSPRVAPIAAIGAIVAGVLLARGGLQREIVVVAIFLLLGLRAVGLAFRDWREPVAGSFLAGALVLAFEAIVGTSAPQDWSPPLIVLMPVFFVGSMASRAVSVWRTDDAEELSRDERDRSFRRAMKMTVWIPVAMLVSVGLGQRNGALDHVGSLLAPVGNALVSLMVFLFMQLARPIFWLVDKLGIDPEGARRMLDRVAANASRARDRAVDHVGQPSVIGRLLGLAVFLLLVVSLIRFMRRLKPEPVSSDVATDTLLATAEDRPLPQPVDPAPRATRHEPPPDRVRRWYGEVITGLARRGVELEATMTPAEFAPDVAVAYPECGEAFGALTRAYEDVRYGSARLDRSTLRELDAYRRSILTALRRRPPTPPEP
jgi:Domain of unknown function (DUF4129)